MFRSATKSEWLRELIQTVQNSLKDSRDILRDVSRENKNRGYSLVLPGIIYPCFCRPDPCSWKLCGSDREQVELNPSEKTAKNERRFFLNISTNQMVGDDNEAERLYTFMASSNVW